MLISKQPHFVLQQLNAARAHDLFTPLFLLHVSFVFFVFSDRHTASAPIYHRSTRARLGRIRQIFNMSSCVFDKSIFVHNITPRSHITAVRSSFSYLLPCSWFTAVYILDIALDSFLFLSLLATLLFYFNPT